jgi:hypothetical protein
MPRNVAPANRGRPSRLAPLLLLQLIMHATFLQKVIICMVAAFLAACLIQWGKVFVEGADDALNAGYKKDEPAIFGH